MRRHTGLSGLRVRLLLLVLLAVLPALALMLYTASEQRRLTAVEARQDVVRLTHLIASDQLQFIEGIRQLLTALAAMPEVRRRDAPACSAVFARLLKQYPRYANLGAATPDGNLFCSALPFIGRVSAAYRAWFQRATNTRDFSIGDFQIGTVTKAATINFSYPVLDEAGQIRAVVFAALDLTWLNQLAAAAQLPPGTILIAIDRQGMILARYPDPENWVGKVMPESRLVQTILAQREGIAEIPGADSVLRVFAFIPVAGTREASMTVAIGIPKRTAFARVDRGFALAVAGLAVVGILALVAAWIGGDLLILRRVNALLTERLAATAKDEGTGQRSPKE